MTITKKELSTAAKEILKKVPMEKEYRFKPNESVEFLINKMIEVNEIIEPEDDISEKTMDVIKRCVETKKEIGVSEAVEETEETEEPIKVSEAVKDAEEAELPKIDGPKMLKTINKTKKLKDIKELVKENTEIFGTLVDKLDEYTGIHGINLLKTEMKKRLTKKTETKPK